MKHYIDITFLPSDDIGVHFLWSKVMMQVHLALVEIQDGNKQAPVAVSFPNYKDPEDHKQGFIGNKLRLLSAEKTDLERLNINKWLSRLEDYAHIKTIAEVPTNITQYESFNRWHESGSADKHIRRRMKRHSETIEQASAFFEGYVAKDKNKNLPFIHMKSLTSQDNFCLSIKRKHVESIKNETQQFNTYGLSAGGVLPKF